MYVTPSASMRRATSAMASARPGCSTNRSRSVTRAPASWETVFTHSEQPDPTEQAFPCGQCVNCAAGELGDAEMSRNLRLRSGALAAVDGDGEEADGQLHELRGAVGDIALEL